VTSVVIAAGGTGGHIYPGLAVADAFRRAEPDVRLSFIGTSRGLEQRLIPPAGWELHMVDMVPFVGWRRGVLPAALVRAATQARGILRAQGAEVVVGMGGYPSIPVIIAARWLRIPAIIHESGAVAGRANRIAARFTPHVAVAFESARGTFNANVTSRVIGMPLSAEMAAFDRDRLRSAARASFGVNDDRFLFVVNGGSQGSARLNDAAVGLADRWQDRDDVHVVVKAGTAHVEQVQASIDERNLGKVATCVRYFDRPDEWYAAADLGLTQGRRGNGGRAGADRAAGDHRPLSLPYRRPSSAQRGGAGRSRGRVDGARQPGDRGAHWAGGRGPHRGPCQAGGHGCRGA
jgi:UDP-N-acetylglucosamine--N-acetylmuramyl-(pentapeptide) pyrophosphoryl-undecaprenol N-acetylglucosamine transferase